jgi:hypothetical protein
LKYKDIDVSYEAYMSVEVEKNPLIQVRNGLRHDLVEFPQIIEDDPQEWWHKTASYVLRLRRQLQDMPTETQEYIGKYLPNVLEILKDEAHLGSVPEGQDVNEYISLRLETKMLELSMRMAEPFDTEAEIIHENITPLDNLPRRHPQNFKEITKKVVQGVNFSVLQVRPSINRPYSSLLIPEDFPIGQKGGGPRGVLDIDQEAPQSMIDSEFPWNDIDAAGAGEEHNLRMVANIMGIDPDGLEIFTGSKVDFSDFALGRDTNQNQVFLDREGLHYSDAAREAAKTGHIEIVGGYKRNKAIYGKDLFTLDGVTLAKPRGLMRLVKPLAEGKALDFDYMDMNTIMDFGVFYLFLGRKWNNKKRFGLNMQRMFHIGQQMHQVGETEENIMQVFERVHTQYPFYDMDKQIDCLQDLVKYMSGKLIKQIDREFGWTYEIPSGIDIVRTPGDDIPHKISLEGFVPSAEMNKQINEWWPQFLLECRKRTDTFNEQPLDPMFKYFIKNELQDAEVIYEAD